MKKGLLVLLSVITLTSFNKANAQSKNVIRDGEKLTYVASYKMAGLMTDIAEIKMVTSKVKTKTSEFYRLKCTASTYAKWDSWFKIRDLYESYVTTSSYKPVLYNRDIQEGGYVKKVKYKFKRAQGVAKTTITKRRGDGTDWVRNFDSKIKSNTQDMVSAIYNTRALDFENYAVGKVIPVDMLIDGEVMNAYITYKGKESVSVGNFGKKECYKVSLDFKKGTFDKAEGSKNMWITADSRRLIAMIKAKIPLGTVQIRLADVQ